MIGNIINYTNGNLKTPLIYDSLEGECEGDCNICDYVICRISPLFRQHNTAKNNLTTLK